MRPLRSRIEHRDGAMYPPAPRCRRRRFGDGGEAGVTSGATRVTSRPPFLALALAVLGTALFAALNVWTRVHDQPNLSSPGTIWEPITWELSSAIATLALIPLVWRGVLAAEKPAERRYTSVVPIMSYALAFYVLHVTTFVLLRWCTYAALGRTYVFGGAMSWLYELPKDVVSFAILFAILMAGRRLGERPHEGKASPPLPDPLKIKDGNRTFLIMPDDIIAASASGNYVQYHCVDGRRPLSRSRFAEAEELLRPHGFLRTHRSWLVNTARVREVRSVGNGDHELVVGDLQVPVSRRFAAVVLPVVS